jgi:hypothetical protein
MRHFYLGWLGNQWVETREAENTARKDVMLRTAMRPCEERLTENGVCRSKAVTLLTRVWEVPGSNSIRDID